MSFAVVLSACHSVATQLLKPTQMLSLLRRQALSVLGDFYNKQQESFVQQDASPKEPAISVCCQQLLPSHPAPQLEWFDANNNVVGPSAQCFGIHLLSHSRMGLSQDLGTTQNIEKSHGYRLSSLFHLDHLRFGQTLEYPGGIPHFQTSGRSPRLSAATRRAPATWLTGILWGVPMDPQRSGHSWY